MLTMTEIRLGSVIEMANQPYVVVWADFMRTAQRKPVKRTKLKNLIDGRVLEHTFKPGDKIAEADIQRRKADYLYPDALGFTFMDQQSYEQFTMSRDDLEQTALLLKEGMTVDVLYYNNKPVSVSLPMKVEYKIIETSDAVKGDTASGSGMSKSAILETGLEVDVPLFIKQGEVVVINTETGEYVGRAVDK